MKFKILETYITDTNDLFIAGRINRIMVYMINLDKGNIKNFDNEDDIMNEKNPYTPMMLLEYPIS